MSYTYLQDQGAESSAACFSDMCQSAPSSWKSIAGNPYSSASVMDCFLGSPSGMTSPPLTEIPGAAGWMSSVEDSLARIFPPLARVRESMATAPGFGGKWSASFVRWDQEECSWKTHRCLFNEALPWCSVTLPNWGSMQGGECWELMTAGLLTGGKESGFWPTPRANESTESLETIQKRRDETGFAQLNLTAAVSMWPTPIAQDAKHSGHAESGPGKAMKLSYMVAKWPTPTVQDSNKATKRWRDDHQNNLTAAVANWPTPTRSDYKGSGKKIQRNDGKMRDRLDYATERSPDGSAINGGRLNPDWVEWLMGWPIGWSSTEPMNGPIQWSWDWWKADPADSGEILRANSGTPGRVARLKAIGNGQVPACAALAWVILGGDRQ